MRRNRKKSTINLKNKSKSVSINQSAKEMSANSKERLEKRKNKVQPVNFPRVLLKLNSNKYQHQSLSVEKLLESKNKSPVRLMRNESALSSYRGMPSAGNKPTDKFLNEVNNIKFVERLLLIKPS